MLRGSLFRPRSYGDWNLATLVRGADALADPERGVVQPIDNRVEITGDQALTSAEIPASAAWYESCPYRRWPMTIQQAV